MLARDGERAVGCRSRARADRDGGGGRAARSGCRRRSSRCSSWRIRRDPRHPDPAGRHAGCGRAGRVEPSSCSTAWRDNFIDNAVAALRLSSLPTVIWWRGGPADILANLIRLADRVVLDADPPGLVGSARWSASSGPRSASVRWTRLTRWRALMAQFFDLPEVQAEAASFTRLSHRGLRPGGGLAVRRLDEERAAMGQTR